MSILEGYVEGMINLEGGGGGGTSDYTELQNKPSINNVELVGNKTTEDLNISYIDLKNKPTIRNMPDSSGAAVGDVLTHTSTGDQWQPPVEELPSYEDENNKYLKVVNGDLEWAAGGGYSETLLWADVNGVSFSSESQATIILNDDIDNYDMLYVETSPASDTIWRHHSCIPVSMIDNTGNNYFGATIVGGNAGSCPGFSYVNSNTLQASSWGRAYIINLYKIIGVKFNG